MPGLSSLAVAAATFGRGGQADRVSTRFSTPFLICTDGTHIGDSTDIMRFAASEGAETDALFPSDTVDELVQQFSDKLGPYTRLAAYFHVLRHDGLLRKLAKKNVTRREARLFSLLYPVGQRALVRSLGITRARAERAVERIDAQLTNAESLLGKSSFLAGESFTAADLTFAAMMAPVLLVTPEQGYGGVLPALDDLDAEAQDLVSRYRERPAGRFALQMYQEHRTRRL